MLNKVQILEVAIEMISDLLSSKSTPEDFKATRAYIFSIEEYIAKTTVCNLYQIVTGIEIFKQKLKTINNNNLKK